MVYFFIYLFIYLFIFCNKYHGFLRSSDVLFYTSNSFMTTFAFLFETTQFQDAIQLATQITLVSRKNLIT